MIDEAAGDPEHIAGVVVEPGVAEAAAAALVELEVVVLREGRAAEALDVPRSAADEPCAARRAAEAPRRGRNHSRQRPAFLKLGS